MASPPCLVRADGAARLRRSAAPSADICLSAEIFSVKPNSTFAEQRDFPFFEQAEMALGLNESVRYGTDPDADYSVAWRSDDMVRARNQLGSSCH